jgi:hypothetical protein
MTIAKKKKIRLAVLVLIMFFGCNYNTHESKQEELSSTLKTAFERLYLAKGGLEYPHSKEALDNCTQHNDKACLDAFNQVNHAKDVIASSADIKTLETTLDIIEATCLSSDEETAPFICYGGIMSLYYYNAPDQDTLIMNRMERYPKTIRNMIFNNEFYWYLNRPDPNKWIRFLESADIHWDDRPQKMYTLDMFKKKLDELDTQPWVLR